MVTRLASILAALSVAIGVQGASVTLTSSGGLDALIGRIWKSDGWAKQFGGAGNETAQSIAVDSSGNYCVAGLFSGTVTFGAFTLTNAGGFDTFVVKLDPTGSVLWANRFGGAGNDLVSCLTVDSSDSVYVGGVFTGANLLKYSSAGSLQFAAQCGTTNVSMRGLSFDKNDAGPYNIAAVGYFSGFTASFSGGTNIGGPGGNESFLVKVSSADGSASWARSFAADSDNMANGVDFDPSGNILVGGKFLGDIDLNNNTGNLPFPYSTNTLQSAGLNDAYLGKFTRSGSYVWSARYGSTGNDSVAKVKVDSAGNFIAGGTFATLINFGIGNMTGGSADLFLAKFSSSNTCVWSRSMPGGTSQAIVDLNIDPSNNPIISGNFGGSLNLGNGAVVCPFGLTYGFVAKYNGASTGLQPSNLTSSTIVSSTATATIGGVSANSDGAVGIAGSFTGTVTIPMTNFVSTYYVATNGNDSAAGTAGAPWLTIGKAVATAIAGDTVNVGAGTFNEFVTNTASGNPGSPISFVGTRSGTNWLTIIDPSTPMTNGWVAAPEIGAGVYKHTGTFITRELTIGNQRVAAVYDMGDISVSLNQAYTSPGITTGTQVLALATSATFTNLHGHVVNFWDGVEAMWGAVSTNTYLRLRDGSDPNGLAIRVSPNHPSLWTTDMVRPAVNINANYVNWRNFAVRNAFGEFYVQGSGNVIESNYLSAGYCRVRIFSGSGNAIQNNEATANYYGYSTPGAWQFASGATNVIREQLYDVSKFLMGVDTSFDEGIDCLEAGANNIVAYNHVYGGIGTGVSAFANLLSYAATTNLVVCSNVISGHPSAGVLLSEGVSSAKVFQNDVQDCNISVRFNHLDSSLDSSRVAYVYRNRLWNPANAGEAFYFHLSSGSAATFFPTLWIYHNSFSGGGGGLEISTFAATSGGLTNTHVLNNIFSGSTYIVNQSTAIMTNAFVLRDFDYNEVTPPQVTFPSTNAPAWWGASNATANAAEWSTSSIPTFTLSPLSKAVDAALNVTAPFVLNGSSYSALPGPSPVMSGTAFDIGVVEMRFPPPVTHLKVAHLQWKH